MTRTVVDTSALIALLYPDDSHNAAAASLLQDAAEAGALIVNPIVYAELAADSYFGTPEELDAFLDDTGIVREPLPDAAQFDAGEAFATYLERRGAALQCPNCGETATYTCPACGESITARQHIAADFLIGAHAEHADRLLTFDTGFYREYFDVDCRTITD